MRAITILFCLSKLRIFTFMKGQRVNMKMIHKADGSTIHNILLSSFQ